MKHSEALVEAHEISKRFGGVKALDSASVVFNSGEVHCLVGENGCGKSTLMKVISGAHRPTAGRIVVGGKSFGRLTPRQAYQLGIEVIYQDFALMPNLTAAENIALPGYVAAGELLVNRGRMLRTAEEALSRLDITMDLSSPVGELTVAERQLCAVARALAHDARFIAMDEPTTALTWKEVDALFDAVRRLRDAGTAIVFISHKMQEVFDISDRVSVMRNGRIVAGGTPADFTHDTLARTMTGRDAQQFDTPVPTAADRPAALEVRALSLPPLFADVSFTVRQGEIVGLSGLLGSGRTEIAEAVVGVRRPRTGTVKVQGKQVDVRTLQDAVKAGIGYVPEDRLTQGLFLDQPIGDNIIATHLSRLAGALGLLSRKQVHGAQRDAVRDLRIKIGRMSDPVRSLSGGNAQRVLLAKWLLGEPKALVLNGPTVGVDVGSKFDILGVLNARALQGLGVLIISDDVPELVSTCHRVLVVRSGRIAGELAGTSLTAEALVKAIAS